jgi:hypothetical protein
MTNKSKATTNSLFPILLLLAVVSFLAGRGFNQKESQKTLGETQDKNALEFSVNQNNQPEFEFYVMSFCPYGNQIESVLKPVYDLLGDKVNWKPQYIFSQVQDTQAFCDQRIYNEERCLSYIDQGYFTDLDQCQQNFVKDEEECKNRFLLEADNTAYSSLHGRAELNQDVREICAYDQDENKDNWWTFIGLVNQNCTSENADSCWEQEAKDSGLDTEKIKTCFNQNATQLISQHLKKSEENQVQSSPTVLINGQFFPPEELYQQGEGAQFKIGQEIFSLNQLRTPEAIKQAICASFKKAPKECKTKLEDQPGAVSQGGC